MMLLSELALDCRENSFEDASESHLDGYSAQWPQGFLLRQGEMEGLYFTEIQQSTTPSIYCAQERGNKNVYPIILGQLRIPE